MPTGILRVAVCQLECHPALILGDLDYLREPVIPEPGGPSLASMSRFALDVADLQAECAARYHAWHSERLARVLQHLSEFKPIPHLIVFPEAAIPFDLLGPLREFALKHDVTVFSGTHSLQLTHKHAQRYKQLKIDGKVLKSWGEQRSAGCAVLTVFSGSNSQFRLKSVPSVFERTDIRRNEGTVTHVEALPLRFRDQRVDVAPLVCAEALQRHHMPESYELVVLCAYNDPPAAFDPLASQHVSIRVPVVLANDGRYGGSGVFVPIDRRLNAWWWGDPNHGRLPAGDGILVVDIDWQHLAPQVGIADPQPAAQLVSCSSVVYEDADDGCYAASSLLETARTSRDNGVQRELLAQALEKAPKPIQRLRVAQLERLAEKGTADAHWWECLACECRVPAQPDIRALEQAMLGSCVQKLQAVLQDGSIEDESVLGRLAKLIGRYRQLAGATARHSVSEAPTSVVSAIINRDDECRELRCWFESSRISLGLVTGLSAVGKSSVIDKEIQQGGYRHVLRLPLSSDSSPEFIVAALLRSVGCEISDLRGQPAGLLRTTFRDRLVRNSLVVIEKGHFLVSDFVWRDPAFPVLIEALSDVVLTKQSTVVIESDCSLDISLADHNRLHRIWVRGLPQDDALLLLDQQLRRTGLSPAHYSEQDRVSVATGLDGHPGAIILAAEYIEQHGIAQVVADIGVRKGIHSRIVGRILKRLHLTEEQATVMSLLSLARVPVPASLLTGITDFNPMPVLRSLLKLALVERHRNDHVAVTGLVRGFADLTRPADTEAIAFHKKAADVFRRLADRATGSEQLRSTVEARYHAYSAGVPAMAPALEGLADGVLGAVQDLLDCGEYEKAQPIIDQLLRAHRTAEILQAGAQIYARLGKCGEALTLAKEAVALQRERVWILTEVGRCALHVHQAEIAEDAIRIAKATGTDSPFIAVLEGRIALRRQRGAEAIAAFRRGTEISQWDGWPHFYLGRTLMKQGEINEAIEVLARGETIESGRRRPRRNALAALRTQLAYAYLLQDDIQTAQHWLGVVANEGDANPEVARALAYTDLRTTGARFADEALARLDPNSVRNRHERAQVHLFRGLFHLSAGHREQASEEFSRASQADPRNVFVLLRWVGVLIDIAKDFAAEGEHEAARVCAEQAQTVANKVLEFDSDNVEALRVLEELSDEFNVM